VTTTNRRVVFVSQMFPPETGGNASRIHDTATNIQRDDWAVTVLAPPPSYPPGAFDRSWWRSRTEDVDGVTVHRLWTWQPTSENPGMAKRLPYYLIFGIHAMVWLLWNVRNYDIVITSTPPISTGAPGLVASALGTPWVVDIRDLWIDASISLGYLESGSAVERASRRFQRLVLRRADRLTVTTETLGRAVAERYGEELELKTVVVPNGVDTERFRPATAVAAESGIEAASRLVTDGLASNGSGGGSTTEDDGRESSTDSPPTIVYTGNLGTAQNLEACVEAMRHVSEPAVFRLVGSGDVESKLRRLVDDLGVGDRVEFTGLVSRDEVPEILGDATIGVAPLEETETLAYAMPTKVYEYMACGLPTVVTGRGEIRRFVTESDVGVHAEGDPEALADRFDELLADRGRRNELAVRSREHVVEHYDRTAIARRLSDELRTLVGDHESA
jgi:glycosyltransferase involved in cell wall biosynthesis